MTSTKFAFDKSTFGKPLAAGVMGAATAEVRDGWTTLETNRRDLMVRTTFLTWNAEHVAETVGKGKGRTTFRDYATEIGASATTVSMARLLGLAVYVHGVQVGSKAWSALVQKGTQKDVAALIRATDDEGNPVKSTPGALLKACEIASAPKVSTDEADNPTGGNPKSPKTTPAGPFEEIIAAAAVVRKALEGGTLSAAQIKSVKGILSSLDVEANAQSALLAAAESVAKAS